MEEDRLKFKQLHTLRGRAEEFMRETPSIVDKIPREDIQKLVHELQVYQIELEMQNEELRRLQGELEDSRNKYFDLYDLAPVGYFTFNVKGIIKEVNLTGARLLGIERGRLLQRGISQYVVEAFRDVLYAHRKIVLETKERQSCELKMIRVDGSEFYGLVESVADTDGQGEPVGLRCTITDITQQKEAEEERTKLICELEAKNAEMERFIYTVSHDLRSPLVTIHGFLGMLKEGLKEGNTEQVEDSLNWIGYAAARMTNLLEELLELSRIGRLENSRNAFGLDKVTHEAINLLASLIRERGVEIRVKEGLPTVVGYRTRLVEVMQNLIENGVKYMGDQTQPRIEIGARQDGDETVLYVRDNGIGIEEQYQEKVFGLFEKLNSKSNGSGTGLAIVKRIIEIHGGRLWVESAGPGKGSCFCFTIP